LTKYDAAGRLTAVVLPAVPDPVNGNQPTHPTYQYGYDAFGNQTLIRDPLGRETRLSYDGQGHQLTRTLPLGFGPDGVRGTADDGDLPEGGFTETFAYDDRGRQTLQVSFEGVVTQSLYDPATGQLSEQRFFPSVGAYNGGAGTPSEVWDFKYDAFGRQVEVRQTAGASVRTTTTSYDGEGRVSRIVSPEETINYEYDNLGRHTRTYSGTAASPINDTRYSYDALSRLATVTVYERDGQALATPEVTAYEYDLLGNMALVRQADGVIVAYAYDALNRLVGLTQYAPDATPLNLSDNPRLAGFDYTLRADGSRSAATETFWLGGQAKVNLAWIPIQPPRPNKIGA
jgi:YD repeat-containing protein